MAKIVCISKRHQGTEMFGEVVKAVGGRGVGGGVGCGTWELWAPGTGFRVEGRGPQTNGICTKTVLTLYAREREIALAWQENLALEIRLSLLT